MFKVIIVSATTATIVTLGVLTGVMALGGWAMSRATRVEVKDEGTYASVRSR